MSNHKHNVNLSLSLSLGGGWCSSLYLTDVDFKDLASNPDKLTVANNATDYVPKARKKRRSSSGSASSATASSKKKSKRAKAQDQTNNSNHNSSTDSQVALTNHERLPEVITKKVFVSYFETINDERGGTRNDM